MATTVNVKNISKDTTESQVRDFFSFCGKITALNLSSDGSTQSATVSFEKATAGKTALLLDNTQLGPNIVNVTGDVNVSEPSASEKSAAAAEHEGDRDIDQEDKPRSRILAEYLAHGYVISDKAIQSAIEFDNKNGYSSRFTQVLQQFDQKYKATEQTKSLDQKYKVTENANRGWATLNSYFEKAVGTPTGRKLHEFYQQGSKQVLDVHNEARRLANLKAGVYTPSPVPGDNAHTKCNCGGESGVCGCAPGACRCSSCPKNDADKSSTEAEKSSATPAAETKA